MTNFKEVKISQICYIERWNSKYTKTYIDNNKWEYNLYSSKTFDYGLMWKIDFFDYDIECLTYTINWFAWKIFYREKHKFSLNWDTAIIFLKEDIVNISYKYLFNILQLEILNYWFNWSNKASPTKVNEIFIKIPIKENWEFDLAKQKEIALKYEKIEKLKDRIRIMKEDFEWKNVIFNFIWNYKEISINEVFDLQRWKSLYTKQYWNDNKWEFPVYSAWKEKLTSINSFDFDWEYLTWATNWFAWYLKRINWKFSINADRWIFIPKTQNIDIDFIKYSIQGDLRNLTKWRIWDKWKNEFTKLSPDKIKDNIFIKIPVKENWEFDLEKQKEIAFKYEKIEKYQKTLIEELGYLEKVKIEI